MSFSNSILCSTRLKGMLLCALLLCADLSFSQCKLDTLDLPNDSFFDAIDAISSNPINRPELGLLHAQLSFSGPKPDPEGKFEKPPYDAVLQLQFDAMLLRSRWEKDITSQLTDSGCSSQRVHSFKASTEKGVLHGYFHAKYVKRSCGDYPWPLHGGWATDLATIETDVWQDFSLSTSDDHIVVGMTGHAQDNVSQLARDAAKVIGNIFAICPLTGGLVLGLDKQVFESLKAERDALEEAGRFRVVANEGLNQDDPNSKFTLASASFDGPPDHLVINVTAVRSNLDRTQACKLRDDLTSQEKQGTNLKVATTYSVNPGDSAWSIARQMYGDGHYYWLLAGLNNLNAKQINDLQVGQKLTLQSLGSVLRSGGLVVIRDKDTLWRISKATEESSGTGFSEILTANRNRFEDPNLIFPLQLAVIPPAKTKTSVASSAKLDKVPVPVLKR